MSTPAPNGQCQRCGGPAKVYEATGEAGVIFRVVGRSCEACEPQLVREWDQEEREELLPKLLLAAGMTPRLEPFTLASYPRDEQGEKVLASVRHWYRDFIAGERRNLVLFGGVGAGKSGLSWGIVRALVEWKVQQHFDTPRSDRGVAPLPPAMFVVFRDLLAEMKRSFGGSEVELPLLDKVRRAPLLVLDDVGAERPTDWARDELAQLVEHRYANGSPSIVTSNYDADALARRLGHDDPIIGRRIVSRLTEGATQVEFFAKDRRLAA